MISSEVETELRSQFAIWAGAYKNIGSYSAEIAALQFRISELQEKIEQEEHIQENAQAVLDAMLSDVEDTDENMEKVEMLMAEELGPALVRGFIS